MGEDALIVIGDIHGCSKSLKYLLEIIPEGREIYSTGDLIDRGPDPAGVVALCIKRGIKPVMGNHEHMFLDYIDNSGLYDRGTFLMNGGASTLHSYGGVINEEHIEFIRKLPLHIETDHFILSHAGVNRVMTLAEAGKVGKNLKIHILWNRAGLSDIGKLQVTGHNVKKEVTKIHGDKGLIGISIDTGCVYPHFGKLSAVSFPEMEIFQVECMD